MTTEKELKKQLRALRKYKRDAQKGSSARREINKQIRDVKKELGAIEEQLRPSESKQKLIEELTELYRFRNKPMFVDLRAYTEEQLQVHLNKMKGNTT